MEPTIMLGGKPFRLQPGFQALSALEKELSASITLLAVKLSEGEMTLEELATVIAFCAQPPMPMEQVKAGLLSSGFSHAAHSAAGMFSAIFCGLDAPSEGMAAMNRSELEWLSGLFPD